MPFFGISISYFCIVIITEQPKTVQSRRKFLEQINIMKIESVEVGKTKIGIHSMNPEGVANKNVYYCRVVISYEEVKKKKINYLFDVEYKTYRGVLICSDFFVVGTTTEYRIYDENGTFITSIPVDSGRPVGVQADAFVLLKGCTITGYGKDGKAIGSRELSPEDLKKLEGK